ncbi:MAG: L-tyrosine/L-tryptophan isonitrile synthase family protein [Blastocatellia bacterium]
MDNESPGFLEPFGHDQPLSKIERVWQRRIPGTSLTRRRVASFDLYSGISFSPIEYQWEPIDYSHLRPITAEWVREAFINFVKGEFDEGRFNPEMPYVPVVIAEADAKEGLFTDYMLSCERNLLYPYANVLVKHTEQDMTQALLQMFFDKELGNEKNRKFVNTSKFDEAVSASNERQSRLLFVLPSFAFKDQNYLRSYRSKPSEFGFGEVSLMIRLHIMSLAFYQVHPWGTDWLLATDGVFYAKMFDIDLVEAHHNFSRLRHIRNQLNLQGTVSMIDLTEIVDHYAAGCGTRYAEDRATITKHLNDLATSDQEDVANAFAALKRGMRQGQSTREIESELSLPELWAACMWEDLPDTFSAAAKNAHQYLDAKAREIAIQYACENLLLRFHQVYDKVFPENIRTTVHPKLGQIAVPTLGSCFPWNGVALLPQPDVASTDSLKVRRFYELGRHYNELVAYRDSESQSLMFFSPAT